MIDESGCEHNCIDGRMKWPEEYLWVCVRLNGLP